MSLSIGDTLPEFTLTDQEGQVFNVAERIGNKPLVLFFYPKDFTPGCTREVCDFRDQYEDFTALGAQVIGISSDSTNSHAKFAARYRLPFTLLSDTRGQVRKLFGIKNSVFNLFPGRETFVFDGHGKLVHRYRNTLATDHMKQALAAVKKLK